MNLARIVCSLVIGGLSLAALPVEAGQRERRNDRGRGGERTAVPRSAIPDGLPGGASAGPVVVDQRGYARGPERRGAPPPVYRPSRGYSAPVYRGYSAPAYYGPRIRYSRPYYAFRPRVTIGFGVWAGFPVTYPAFGYGYPVPYPYSYPVAQPYPAPYPVPYPAPYPYPMPYGTVYPSQAPSAAPAPVPPGTYGGVSFAFTPEHAEIYVDGGYAGRASDFDSQSRPLTLAPGLHRIEVRAPGYRTLAFDVTISPGQVIPYQGSLQPEP